MLFYLVTANQKEDKSLRDEEKNMPPQKAMPVPKKNRIRDTRGNHTS